MNSEQGPTLHVSHLYRTAGAFSSLLVAALLAGCPTSHSGGHDSDGDVDSSLDASSTGSSDASTRSDAMHATDATFDSGSDASVAPARLLAFAIDGHAASLDTTDPWTSRATATLASDVASVQCLGLRCLVTHSDPTNTVDLIDALTLAVVHTFTLAAGSDPRDGAFIDTDTALVSQYGSADVLELDLTTFAKRPISLIALADDDQIPESSMIAICGTRAYVQLARIDHDTMAPSALGGTLAVLDFALPGRVLDIDPIMPGTQGVVLVNRAAFDMVVDCAGARLYVAEPKPLFQGGGGYQVVDLTTLVASTYDIASSAEVGGFEVVSNTLAWRITHTDFGPGASSHLELVGAGPYDTYNTFSGQHVDDLALDRADDLLFFPDPCIVTPSNQSCSAGVHAYRAHTGEPASVNPIAVAFEPIEVAIAR